MLFAAPLSNVRLIASYKSDQSPKFTCNTGLLALLTTGYCIQISLSLLGRDLLFWNPCVQLNLNNTLYCRDLNTSLCWPLFVNTVQVDWGKGGHVEKENQWTRSSYGEGATIASNSRIHVSYPIMKAIWVYQKTLVIWRNTQHQKGLDVLDPSSVCAICCPCGTMFCDSVLLIEVFTSLPPKTY